MFQRRAALGSSELCSVDTSDTGTGTGNGNGTVVLVLVLWYWYYGNGTMVVFDVSETDCAGLI